MGAATSGTNLASNNSGGNSINEGHTSNGYIIANSGKKVPVRADTICIHGDEPTGPAVAQAVRKMLDREGIAVKPLPELNFG